MAGLAGAALPSLPGVDLQIVVWVLGEAVGNVFMTDLAGVGTRIARRKRSQRRPANYGQERD